MIAPVGSVINLYGSGFTSTASVFFNSLQATSVAYISSGQLNVTVPQGASSGYITVSLPNGCTAISSAIFGVGQTPVNTALNLKIFIQGFYAGGGLMNAVLDPGNPLQCDSITVELRSSLDPSQVIAVRKGIVSTSGNITFYYPSAIGNTTYYLVVKHRSSLETWSKNPVYFPVGGAITYNFTAIPAGNIQSP
jgi:hypothetical protein